MKIVECDNFDRGTKDERFVNLPPMTKEHAQEVADAINSGYPESSEEYYKVVPDDYELRLPSSGSQ